MSASIPPVARADRLIGAAVLCVAAAVASTTARNSDLWLHLATGREIANGDYTIGVDPFGYTTAGNYWANHTWLADLLMYFGDRAVGGGGLVALKALAVTVTVGIMLATARRPAAFWVSGVCVTLALLVMTPRLLLQPVVGSILLLAVVLYLLQRGERSARWVPVVIAAWVNLDGWYVLGPLVVSLFVVGRQMNRTKGSPRIPLWVLPTSFGACLVSPHHVRGLTLPFEVSPAVLTSAFADDPRFANLFASPWRLGPLGAAGGYSLAAWAFFVLLGLGVASFALNRSAILGWRGLVWLAFAGLAAWQARLIPFFAVVAGPITALNLRERLPTDVLVRPGRLLAGGVGVALLALVWPGWLQGFNARDRGLAWAVYVDPSLARAAATVARWRADGTLPPGTNTFATDPDTAHYLVWANPGERVFLDSRLELFVPVADEYEDISRAFDLVPPTTASPTGEAALRARNVSVVLIHDPDSRRAARGFRAASRSPERWFPLRVDGSVVLFGRAEVRGWATARFDPERLAFGPVTGEWPGAEILGPPPAARPLDVWEQRHVPCRTAWEGDGASTALQLFNLESDVEERSPALPLLAVRAARAAVQANPKDDDAWATLGRAYLLLNRGTWEATAGDGFPLLALVRHAQSAAALHQAVIRNPDSVVGHEGLAGLFNERGYLDLAHHHRQNQHRLAGRAGRLPGETAEAFAERMSRSAESVATLEAAVQDAENRFVVQTDGLAGDPLARARTAARLGLVDRAITTLVSSHADLYGAEGLRLLLDLLLSAGRAADARTLLFRDELAKNQDSLGVHRIDGGTKDGRPWGYAVVAYDWFYLCESAASGAYAGVDARCQKMIHRARSEEDIYRSPVARGLVFQEVSEASLGADPRALFARTAVARERVRLSDLFAQVRFLAAVRGDLWSLDAVLWMEVDPKSAASTFELAGQSYAEAGPFAPARPGAPLAERYLRAVRAGK